jgi:hypothetical protein
MNTVPTPKTIEEYLEQVRAALGDADPALVQDALYDAEDHLRSELAEQPGVPEAEVIAKVATSYGSPEEVAAIYRDTEVKVSRALRPPPPPRRQSALGRFFGVAADPRTYASLFYMLLSLATGIFYFTWAVTGAALSAGLMILIIGIPFLVLFLATVRALSLVEGRLVEVMLGERMPRRPIYADHGKSWLERAGAVFTDTRTWSTLLYMVLMLPLGIVYFVTAVVGLTVSTAFIAAPIGYVIDRGTLIIDGDMYVPNAWALPFLFVAGVLLLFTLMHLARGIGRVHGQIAKNLGGPGGR